MRFFVFVGLCVAGFIWFTHFVGTGGFVSYLDAHAHQRGTATALYYLGQYYDLFSKDEKAYEAFSRIAERYPKSRYGEDALLASATALEKMKKFKDALAEYQKFLEKYPHSRAAATVRNNVDILK